MSFLSKFVDERFLEYRRRSTSLAGMAGAVVAWALFEYRYFFRHEWSWDLLAVLLAIALVKLGLMVWWYFTK
ncbi:MAG TPA: hypothetical protein VKF80_08910 [Candidatus Eisenbacteria bacterium]|nr:hypothetical protein [Candidatus Eisenbacteria bacterium]